MLVCSEEPTEKDKRQKTKGSGFASPHPISEELMQFFDTDESELSRSEVVKRMWKYIKDNDLQVSIYSSSKFILTNLYTNLKKQRVAFDKRVMIFSLHESLLHFKY